MEEQIDAEQLRFPLGLGCGICRENDHARSERAFPDERDDGQAACLLQRREAQVGNHHIEDIVRQQRLSLFQLDRTIDVVSPVREVSGYREEKRSFVVYNQDSRFHSSWQIGPMPQLSKASAVPRLLVREAREGEERGTRFRSECETAASEVQTLGHPSSTMSMRLATAGSYYAMNDVRVIARRPQVVSRGMLMVTLA